MINKGEKDMRRKPKAIRSFIKMLISNGYYEMRSKGSHFIYTNGVNHITVNKDLNRMVQRRLIKENDLIMV